jgi:hypothetical protein
METADFDLLCFHTFDVGWLQIEQRLKYVLRIREIFHGDSDMRDAFNHGKCALSST